MTTPIGRRRWLLVAAMCMVLVLALCLEAQGKTKLVLMAHWGGVTSGPIEGYIDEYERLNPDIEIEYRSVEFGNLLTRISLAHQSPAPADIYHVYHVWMSDLHASGLLAEAPETIAQDVINNYAEVSRDLVTIDGKVYGYPTELNTVALVYNKALLEEAGLDPPSSWYDLITITRKLTKKGQGAEARWGHAFYTAWDSVVVFPWVSLLLTNGGQYLNDGWTAAAFNSPEGRQVMEFYTDLMEAGADPRIDGMRYFKNEQVATLMLFSSFKKELEADMGDRFSDVGTVPIPTNGEGSAKSLAFGWQFVVDSKSKKKEEAWRFLEWLNREKLADGATRMGHVMAELGAMPGRYSDIEALSDVYQSGYFTPFADVASNSAMEPNPIGGAEIKSEVFKEITAFMLGQKSGDEALASAEKATNRILSER